MISKFNLTKVIVAGTCAGIDDHFSNLDILIPNKAVQYDCTVKEIEPLIKQSFIVDIDLSKYGNDFYTGIIATADKAVVMWKDYLELRENKITIADTEAGAIAYICKKNNVECIIIKGISFFLSLATATSDLLSLYGFLSQLTRAKTHIGRVIPRYVIISPKYENEYDIIP